MSLTVHLKGTNTQVLVYGGILDTVLNTGQLSKGPLTGVGFEQVFRTYLNTVSKHVKGSKEHLFITTQTQSANFGGNPLSQATKQHLTVKWIKMKN